MNQHKRAISTYINTHVAICTSHLQLDKFTIAQLCAFFQCHVLFGYGNVKARPVIYWQATSCDLRKPQINHGVRRYHSATILEEFFRHISKKTKGYTNFDVVMLCSFVQRSSNHRIIPAVINLCMFMQEDCKTKEQPLKNSSGTCPAVALSSHGLEFS